MGEREEEEESYEEEGGGANPNAHSPLLLVVVVDSIDDVLLPILDNLPHGPAHHVAGREGSDGQSVPLAWGGVGRGGGCWTGRHPLLRQCGATISFCPERYTKTTNSTKCGNNSPFIDNILLHISDNKIWHLASISLKTYRCRHVSR